MSERVNFPYIGYEFDAVPEYESPQEAGLWHRLLEIDSRKPNSLRASIGRRVLTKVIQDSKIKDLVIVGPPGTGKSSEVVAAISELERLSGGAVRGSLVSYERAEAKTVEELGISVEDPRFNWRRLNENLVFMQEEEPPFMGDGVRVIRVHENVGVGRKDYRDRGVTAFDQLAERIRVNEDGVVLINTPNPLIQQRSVKIRGLVSRLEPSMVESHLLTRFNLLVTGGKGSRFSRMKSPYNRGVIIKRHFGNMAQEDHVRRINEEVSDLGSELFVHAPNEDLKDALYFVLPQSNDVDDRITANSLNDFLRWTLVYSKNRVRESRIPEHLRAVVLNPIDDKAMHYVYISDEDVERLEEAA